MCRGEGVMSRRNSGAIWLRNVLLFVLLVWAISLFFTALRFRESTENLGINLAEMMRRCGEVNVRQVYGENVQSIILVGSESAMHVPEMCQKSTRSYTHWGGQAIVTIDDNQCNSYEFIDLGIQLSEEYFAEKFTVTNSTTLKLDNDSTPNRISIVEDDSTEVCE